MPVSQTSNVTPLAHRHTKLPLYLFKRANCYYFKRRVPSDARLAFGCVQVWKSLGTDLLEKAKMLLAVEISEFEFKLARVRRDLAAAAAGLPKKSIADEADIGGTFSPSSAVIPQDISPQAEIFRALEYMMQRLGRVLPAEMSETIQQPSQVAVRCL